MKQVVKILKAAMKSRELSEVATDLALSTGDLRLVLDGSMEISAVLAMKIEQALGVDAHDLLSAQSADQLEILGHQRVKKVKVPEATTRSDGQPSQSPMFGAARSQTGRAVG